MEVDDGTFYKGYHRRLLGKRSTKLKNTRNGWIIHTEDWIVLSKIDCLSKIYWLHYFLILWKVTKWTSMKIKTFSIPEWRRMKLYERSWKEQSVIWTFKKPKIVHSDLWPISKSISSLFLFLLFPPLRTLFHSPNVDQRQWRMDIDVVSR